MNRKGLIVGLAALILLGVLGYFWLNRVEPGAPSAQVEPVAAGGQADLAKAPESVAEPQAAQAPAEAVAVTGDARGPSAEKVPEPVATPEKQDLVARIAPQDPAAPAAAPSTAKPSVKTRQVAPPRDTGLVAILPSFDVVRVEPSGEAVLAGRATAGSSVRLIDGSQALAEVLTNPKGEWVIVLRVPLAPGAHELSLESRLTTGEILLSENVVVVSVPAPALVAGNRAPSAAAPSSESVEPADAGAARQVQTPASAVPSPDQPIETLRPLAVLMPRTGTGPSRIIQAPEPVPSQLGDKALLLETVDYDDEGRAVIGGRGAAGVALILYLDSRPAGRTVIGPEGRWRAQLEGEVPFGVHTLRVDQVSKTGQVVARVESPFSRANLLAAADDETAVIVQPGNSLWRIARRIYGEGMRYSVIYAANENQIGDPDLIYPGQIFVVPKRN